MSDQCKHEWRFSRDEEKDRRLRGTIYCINCPDWLPWAQAETMLNEHDALKQELAIGQGFVLDYLLKGDADNELEPFYSWCKRVRALLEGSE